MSTLKDKALDAAYKALDLATKGVDVLDKTIMGSEKPSVNNGSFGDNTVVFKTLTCPECGASLEASDSIGVLYCQYCGHKILLDGSNKTIIKAQIKEKRMDTTKSVISDISNSIRERREEKRKERKKSAIIGIIMLSISMLLLSISSGSLLKESQKEERELEQILEEIQVDIRNEDYDQALIKANSLYYTSGYSGEIEKKWNEQRKAIIELIKNKQQVSQITQQQNTKDDPQNYNSIIEESQVLQASQQEIIEEGESFDYPVIKGAIAYEIVSVIQSFGVDTVSINVDIGHGTQAVDIDSADNEYWLSLVYVADTNDLLLGEVATTGKDNATKHQYIIEVGKLFCEESHRPELEKWISENIGKDAYTEINGTDYHIFNGTTGAPILDINEQAWNTWNLQFE